MTLREWIQKREHGAIKALAEAAGVSRQTIHVAMRGDCLRRGTARAIRRATKYQVDLSAQVREPE